ncbi:50S ribosomal protein L10 [Candidatus Gracilibacteria bacterium]|nr:50S ribosomal protein L10 [Candidatus Gracilibacteria bacterium]MCF7898529.1 50S ribosomal protein L10 [Candidatus Paceibacterota bacterium]
MALTRAKKAELISSYTDAIKGAKSAVYVKFKGLSVADTSTLRGQLFSENTHYTVVKKTLWKRATEANSIKGDAPETGEELAVVYGEDLLTPARLSYEFSKIHKGTFTILGGIFDGSFKNQSEMLSIATIPPREVLLSQLAYLLKSPMTKLAVGLNEVALKKTA